MSDGSSKVVSNVAASDTLAGTRRGLLAAGAAIVLFGVAFALLQGIYALATRLAPWQAAAFVAAVSGIGGTVCASLGVTLLWRAR